MSPESWAALITALVAAVAAAYGIRQGARQHEDIRKLQEQRSELARQEAVDKAKLDYEYDARRRLYEHFEPLRFQLLDSADFALERIRNLTDQRTWKELRPASDDADRAGKQGRAVMAAPTYELVATLYGLLAPLAIVRSMSRELTLADLALDPRIELQYHLGSRAYGVVKDDQMLADKEPAIKYDPSASGWRELRQREPSAYWWQGISMGRLEIALDLMRGSDPGRERLASFGEFEATYEDVLAGDDHRKQKALAAASNALLNFRPADRPVYWRVLIAQACLYDALLKTRLGGVEVPTTIEAWDGLLRLEDQVKYDWRVEAEPAPGLDDTMRAVTSYLNERVVLPWLSTHSRASG